jgi:hypothetical protein
VSARAEAFAAHSSLSSALATWKKRRAEWVLDERKADVARGFFVERRYWGQWVKSAERRKKERWLERRERNIVGKTFRSQWISWSALVRIILTPILGWLALTRKAKAEQAIVEAIQSAIDQVRIRRSGVLGID